ncbi:uncharacterized protein [Miscanthus floridulus]|uniref:uncharacterized protein isoform X1 n=1 Tax=Miscanthus floridulus TaxID=154761 RepID=UPI0034587A27
MMTCPAATTARIGARRGPCLWRSKMSASVLVGSASLLPDRPARDTRARASELQQAPRPASTTVPTHKVTVHDRQRGVVHEFVGPEVHSLAPKAPTHYTPVYVSQPQPGNRHWHGLMVVTGPVHSTHRGGAGHQIAVRVPPRD